MVKLESAGFARSVRAVPPPRPTPQEKLTAGNVHFSCAPSMIEALDKQVERVRERQHGYSRADAIREAIRRYLDAETPGWDP